MNRMLKVREIARILNVHENTIRRWSNKGIITTYRINCRGDRRFSYADITHFLGDPVEKHSPYYQEENV